LGKLFATISLMMNPPSDSHFDMVSIITLLTSALKFFPYVTTSKSSISMLLIILFSAELEVLRKRGVKVSKEWMQFYEKYIGRKY
jgi:hypothetical protein